MGVNEDYGKRVLRVAAGGAFLSRSDARHIDYGAGEPCFIDGVIGDRIAVEIEARPGKQTRGALMDLVNHAYPKKLLVLIPVNMNDPEVIAEQSRNILGRFMQPADFQVVLLHGTPRNLGIEADAELIRAALLTLGFQRSAAESIKTSSEEEGPGP